jgi:hypothetical protein
MPPMATQPPMGAAFQIETVRIATGDQPWQVQRVITAALRRRRDCLAMGEGVCAVIDARRIRDGLSGLDGVEIDLEVPSALERCEFLRSGASLAEIWRLVMPIVESLCALHDAGLAHGRIEIASIRRRPDGRGVLVGFDPDAQPGQDVAHMAGLILDLVPTGSINGHLATLLTRAIDPDPRHQPTMADLAEALSRGNHATPVSSGSKALSPPARRRVTAWANDAEVPRRMDSDSVTRLRRRGSPSHRHARSRSQAIAIPWPLIAGIVGSSAMTWIVASLLR